MSESTTKSLAAEPATEQMPPVRWIHWPLREQPRLAALAMGSVAIAGILTWFVSGKIYLGLFAAAAVLIVQRTTFLPISYEMNPAGVRRVAFRYSLFVRWTNIDRIIVHSSGITLVPKSRFGLLDVLRIIYVPWGTERDEVLHCIETYVAPRIPPE